jgi:serine/threonine-protein kinase
LVSGRTVHDAETSNELLLASMTQAAPPVTTFAPDVTGDAADLINRALAFEKTERFVCAADMLEAVRAVVDKLEEARRERGFVSSPPLKPDRRAFSSFPPPSTFRPVAMSERPTVAEEPPKKLKPRALLAAALLISGITGYLLVMSERAREAAAPVTAHTGSSPGESADSEAPTPEKGADPARAAEMAPASRESTTPTIGTKTGKALVPSKDDDAAQVVTNGIVDSVQPHPAAKREPKGTAEATKQSTSAAHRAAPRTNSGDKQVDGAPPEDFDPLSLRR